MINDKFRNLLLTIFITAVIWIAYESFMAYRGTPDDNGAIPSSIPASQRIQIDEDLIEDLSNRIAN